MEKVGEMTFDLLKDVDRSVGITLNEKFVKRYYGVNDTDAILESISNSITNELKKQDVGSFNLLIFGVTKPGIFAKICVQLKEWEEIEHLYYKNPLEETDPIFIF